jgi:hypothetical protein
MRKRESMEIMVEREACAQIAEHLAADLDVGTREHAIAVAIGEMIRARSDPDDDHGRIK